MATEADTETAIEALDVMALFKQAPPGMWMAVSKDGRTVVAFAADAKTAVEEARQKGEANPIILRHPENIDFIF